MPARPAPPRPSHSAPRERGTARTRLLDAAIDVVRAKGLHATSVDDLCAAAGVTKGAFFHHFESKDALAVAAAEHWSEVTGAMFAAAAYHDRPTAAERVMGYLDLRAGLVSGPPASFTCLAGTMTQEAFDRIPPVREACRESIFGHAATLEADLAEALADAGHEGPPDAASLAAHTQAVLQGAFVLAKAADDPQVVLEEIEHLRRYLQFLFHTEGDPR